jgi:hypothetical protein
MRASQTKWEKNNKAKYLVSKRLTSANMNGLNIQTILRPDPDHCEICKQSNNGKILYCEHDHSTGKFRGWVCPACNIALGVLDRLNNDPVYKASITKYLEVESANNAGVEITRSEVHKLLTASEFRRNPPTGKKSEFSRHRDDEGRFIKNNERELYPFEEGYIEDFGHPAHK